METLCIYCGSDSSLVREHVIPASYLGVRTYESDKQWLVTACSICNHLAGAAVFFSIAEKAAYIRNRYKRRYAKVLRIPHWSPEELEEVSYKLRVGIEQSQIARAIVQRRLAHLDAVSEYPRDFLRPAWAEAEWREWLQRQPSRRKRRKRKNAPTSPDLTSPNRENQAV